MRCIAAQTIRSSVLLHSPPVFLNPLGLLALFGVPAVLGLHLFRRRFRRHPVSATFLWESIDHVSIAGRKREPLRTNPSFWCEIVGALLLALAIAGLRVFGAGEAQHLVVVLDSSASMDSVGQEGSPREAALELVKERVGALPRGSRVTLLASGPTPELLAGPAAFSGEALTRMDAYRPTLGRHDLTPALGLAQQLAGDGSVLLITDQHRSEADAWPAEIEVQALGTPIENLAITHASRRREVDEETGEALERVHLTLSNFGLLTRTVDVELLAAGQTLTTRRVTVGPGAREHVSFSLPRGAPVLEARLPDDALAIDNVAYLAPAPPRTLALASTLPEDLAQHLGIMTAGQSVSRIDRWLKLVPDAIDVKDPAAAHLVLAQGLVPGSAWVFSLEQSAAERQHLIGPFLMDKQHPLLEGITLEGIVWSHSPDLVLRGAPVISAGDRPLVTEGRDGERVILRFNLDPRSSSLHRSPDWPILLANAAEMRRRELPGPARTSLQLGETFHYRDRAPAEYRFVGPLGTADETVRELAARGTLAVDGIVLPGKYSLERVDDQGRATPLCEVAYSFVDAAESDLRDLSSGTHEGELGLAAVLAGFSWVEMVLLCAVLALVALDWFVLGSRRRSTGSAPVPARVSGGKAS